jgi:hypothetical protein
VAKAFRHGFYWPTALRDAEELVKKCNGCQRFANLSLSKKDGDHHHPPTLKPSSPAIIGSSGSFTIAEPINLISFLSSSR